MNAIIFDSNVIFVFQAEGTVHVPSEQTFGKPLPLVVELFHSHNIATIPENCVFSCREFTVGMFVEVGRFSNRSHRFSALYHAASMKYSDFALRLVRFKTAPDP